MPRRDLVIHFPHGITVAGLRDLLTGVPDSMVLIAADGSEMRFADGWDE